MRDEEVQLRRLLKEAIVTDELGPAPTLIIVDPEAQDVLRGIRNYLGVQVVSRILPLKVIVAHDGEVTIHRLE
jgi:hypothetical protein